MTEDSIKQAWQASVEIAGAPPLEEVRKKADKFYRKIRLRNSIEYVACAVVVVLYVPRVLAVEYMHQRVGLTLLVLAALSVVWQLHRRASAESPERAGEAPLYLFLRAQLVRQRDALREVFWWYLLPFVPGFAVIFVGNGIVPEVERAGPPIWVRWLILGVMGAIYVGVWWINQLGARRLQRHIDEIDVLMGERG
jgi:hypothetical protein